MLCVRLGLNLETHTATLGSSIEPTNKKGDTVPLLLSVANETVVLY